MKLISLLFSASVALCGCSMVNGLSGMMETVEVDVHGGYSSVDASSSVKVVMTDGASVATVSADTEVLPYVVTELSGKTLKIYVKESYRFRHGIGAVEVILPANDNIRRVSLSGASSFRSESPLAADSFKVNLCGASRFCADIMASGDVSVDISGASSLTSAIKAEGLDVDASGASSANLSGEVRTMSATVSGASKVSSSRDRMTAENVSCSVSGASNLYVNCTASIKGSSSGASHVHYGSSCRSASVSSSGASSVSAN